MMQQAQNLHALGARAVQQHEGRAADGPFAGARRAARSADPRMAAQELRRANDTFYDGLSGQGRSAAM
jgi:hypothetical protein